MTTHAPSRALAAELLSHSMAVSAEIESALGVKHRGSLDVFLLEDDEWRERFLGEDGRFGLSLRCWAGADGIYLRRKRWRTTLAHELVHVIGERMFLGIPPHMEEGISDLEGARASGTFDVQAYESLCIASTGRVPDVVISYGSKSGRMHGMEARPARGGHAIAAMPWREFWDASAVPVGNDDPTGSLDANDTGVALALCLQERVDLYQLLRTTEPRSRARSLEEACLSIGISSWSDLGTWAATRRGEIQVDRWAIRRVETNIRRLATRTAGAELQIDEVLDALDLHVHIGLDGVEIDAEDVDGALTVDVSHHPEVVRIVEEAIRDAGVEV